MSVQASNGKARVGLKPRLILVIASSPKDYELHVHQRTTHDTDFLPVITVDDLRAILPPHNQVVYVEYAQDWKKNPEALELMHGAQKLAKFSN